MDVAAQVPHGPLRAYVMGDRGYRNEDATPEDINRMATLVSVSGEFQGVMIAMTPLGSYFV